MIKFSSVVAFLLANLLLDVVQCLDFNNSQKDAHLLHAAKEHLAVAKNSLQKSTWPADHGDVSRSKYTIGAGLPQYFDPADIQIHTQPRIPSAQWFYTYGNNSEILYTMSGPMSGLTLSKLNSQTLEILQQVALKPSIYMGGKLHSLYYFHFTNLIVFFSYLSCRLVDA